MSDLIPKPISIGTTRVQCGRYLAFPHCILIEVFIANGTRWWRVVNGEAAVCSIVRPGNMQQFERLEPIMTSEPDQFDESGS